MHRTELGCEQEQHPEKACTDLLGGRTATEWWVAPAGSRDGLVAIGREPHIKQKITLTG